MLLIIFLQALPNLSRQPYWYEVIAGVLAIPFIIVSIAYSYVLVKKTRIESQKFKAEQEKLRLESEKIALEIQEKKQTLGVTEAAGESQSAQVIERIVQPLTEGRDVQYIILRFILLFLVTRAIALISVLTDALSEAVRSIALYFDSNFVSAPIIFIASLIEIFPILGIVTFTLLIGIPLFRDVNKIVGSKKIDSWLEKQIEEFNRVKAEAEAKEKAKKQDDPKINSDTQ